MKIPSTIGRIKLTLHNAFLVIARHRLAVPALAGVSFLGGSVAPLPSDIMLIPMVLAHPQRWRYLTLVTVISSVCGAMCAYWLGWFFLADILALWNQDLSHQIEKAHKTVSTWGALALFIAAFLPIPFKILALCYGAAKLSLPAFLLAVTLGRSLRFYLMSAGLVKLQSTLKRLEHEQHAKTAPQ